MQLGSTCSYSQGDVQYPKILINFDSFLRSTIICARQTSPHEEKRRVSATKRTVTMYRTALCFYTCLLMRKYQILQILKQPTHRHCSLTLPTGPHDPNQMHLILVIDKRLTCSCFCRSITPALDICAGRNSVH